MFIVPIVSSFYKYKVVGDYHDVSYLLFSSFLISRFLFLRVLNRFLIMFNNVINKHNTPFSAAGRLCLGIYVRCAACRRSERAENTLRLLRL